MKRVYAILFKLFGWRVEGSLPSGLTKYLLVVAPHTSNWDFLVGLGARAVLNFNPRYVAKKELFFWPVGALFRKLGGYPVQRAEHTDFVQSMVDIFDNEESFILTITPEGTRKYVVKWKTGFFFIAQKANIPIVPVAFDYANKRVVMGVPLMATGEVRPFIQALKKWFSQYKGHNPKQGVFEDV